MTIYKPNRSEKKSKDDKSSVAYENLEAPYVIRVPGVDAAILRRQREHRVRLLRILSVLIFLIVVVISVLSALYFYKRMMHKPYVSMCPVKYHEGLARGSFEEKIEVDDDYHGYAKLQIPSFYDSLSSMIIHEFQTNLTAIVDLNRGMCFIMPLDTKFIQPPSNIIDLLHKFRMGHYIPDLQIIRETYVVEYPEIMDIQELGDRIGHECQYFTNYRIRKDSKGIVKRSTPRCSMAGENFCLGMTSDKYIRCVKLTSCA